MSEASRTGASRPSPRPRPAPADTARADTARASTAQADTAQADTVTTTSAPAEDVASALTPDLAPARSARTSRSGPVTEPRFDPSSWGGALIIMAAFVAVLWGLQIANAQQDYAFNDYGLRPRNLHGLWGVLTGPFLHSGYGRLGANTLPLLLIGWVVLLAGWRLWAFVTVSVVLAGGVLLWAVGPGGAPLVGASELYFGWLGYLIARAVFSRRIRWIVSAAMVLLFFGALLSQLAPIPHGRETWQAHVCGFAVGAAAGWFLHPRHRRRAAR